MDVLKKLRNLGKGELKEGDLKKIRDLYEFGTIAQHGFPNKPTALAYDPKLHLIAVGTQFGSIRIYGKPGVQFSAEVSNESPIDKLAFLPNEGRLIVLCKDGTISLWELNGKNGRATVLEQVKSTSINTESQNLAISCLCLTDNCEEILFGTEHGNINVFNVKDFKLTERVFGRDSLIKKTSDETRGSTGPIESLLQHPAIPNQYLVGFKSGLVSLWNTADEKIEQIYATGTSLETLVFRAHGKEFLAGHSDGSYTVWTTTDSSKPKDGPTTTYGPFPCKGITKIDWKEVTGGETLIFCGGMARSSYNDRHTVSVIQGNKHVVLDFSSRVIDFLTLSALGSDEADTLIVLAEEEVLAIDLSTEGWPEFRLPYMCCIHSSTITSVLLLPDISKETWNKICAAGRSQFEHCSKRSWPLTGGSLNDEAGKRNIFLTGHENGTVSFWDASVVPGDHQLLLTIKTSELFSDVMTHPTTTGDVTQDQGTSSGTDDDWPPFRKVGRFDPFIEDTRLSVQKLEFCPLTETLLIAGNAGQVIVLGLQHPGQHHTIAVDIVSKDSIQYKWTGHEALKLRENVEVSENGFKTVCVAQVYPPSACTAVALQSNWKLFAVGTEHGYALIDYARNVVVLTKPTLVPAGTIPRVSVTRSRSLQRTLRESFRKLRIKPPVSRSFDVVQHAGDESPDKQRSKSDGGEPVAATEMKTLPEEPTTEGNETKPEEGKTETGEEKIQVTEDKTKTETLTGTTGEGTESSAGVVEQTPVGEVAEDKPADIPTESESTEVTATEAADAEPTKQTTDLTATDDANEATHESPAVVETPVELLEVASTVHCLYLTKTYLLQGQPITATLWVGNSLGHVTAYRVSVPSSDKRLEEDVQCMLAKEIHLRHGAAVLSLKVVNRDNKPVTVEATAESAADADHESTAAASSSAAGHRLIVCSQEQIKIFSLPSLKAQHKVKVSTRYADAKIRNFGVAQFIGKTESDEAQKHEMSAVVCLTGDGLVHIYSIPHLKKQFDTAITSQEDSTLATNSCVFSPEGFGCFLRSISEIGSFTLSARHVGHVICYVELPEGVRPVPAPVEAEVIGDSTAEDVRTETVTTEEKPAETSGEEKIDTNMVTLNESALSAAGDVTTDSVQVHLIEEDSVVTTEQTTRQSVTVTESSTTVHVTNGKSIVEESSSTIERTSEITKSLDEVKLGETETQKESSSTETKTVEHISTDIEHLKHEAQKEFAKTEEALGVTTKEISEVLEAKTTDGVKVDGISQ